MLVLSQDNLDYYFFSKGYTSQAASYVTCCCVLSKVTCWGGVTPAVDWFTINKRHNHGSFSQHLCAFSVCTCPRGVSPPFIHQRSMRENCISFIDISWQKMKQELVDLRVFIREMSVRKQELLDCPVSRFWQLLSLIVSHLYEHRPLWMHVLMMHWRL